jgi:CheY-like chemotaxis protein
LPAWSMNPDPDFAKPSLLVVDDDHDLVDALCEWIRLRSGWTAAGAYGPADAIAQAGAIHPDAILLDMEMEGADGFDTAARLDLASGSRHPPLFALTGNPWLRDAAALDTRFTASMLKPADLEVLLRLLDGATPLH